MLPQFLIKKVLDEIKEKVNLIVYGDKEMLDFVKSLAKFSEKIEYEYVGEPERSLKLPAIGFKGLKIYFHGVPKYTELESFLATIKAVTEFKNEKNLDCFVLTFVSQFCPNCRQSVESLNKLAVKLGFEHHIVDVNYFPELAKKYDIKGVPTTYVCDMVFVGALSEKDARKWIEAGSRGDYYEYFAEKLRNGEIDIVKELAIRKKLGKTLAELMAHREFMVRLGAMAVLEEICKRDEELANQAREIIVTLLEHTDERIREDAAMMLGIIGKEEDIKYLKKLLNEEGGIKDSAEEAIENIRGRENG